MKQRLLFIQQNVARRHEPTVALNYLLDLLTPFSFLKRDQTYLESVRSELDTFPGVYNKLKEFVYKGSLPRILPILIVQEPIIKSERVYGFPSKTVISKGSIPRAAIITTKNSHVLALDSISNPDCACALFSMGNKKLIVTSFYHDINKRESTVPFSDIRRKSTIFLIAGDTNAHSTLWGSPSNNTRGDYWEDLIVSNNLALLNDEFSPTLVITLPIHILMSRFAQTRPYSMAGKIPVHIMI